MCIRDRDQTHFGSRAPVSYEQCAQQFRDPDARYAPFMLQFWDALPSPEFAVGVANNLITQGLNPGYIYPAAKLPGYMCSPQRPCLPREAYLSRAWFDAVAAAAAFAEKEGRYLGFNIDAGWPAGLFAAPRILEAHPDLKAVSLRCETTDPVAGTSVAIPSCAFAVAARLEPEKADTSREAPLGQWIWLDGGAPPDTVVFRRVFALPGPARVRRSSVRLTADNAYELYVNGRRIGSHDRWQELRSYDVTNALRPERQNVVAIQVVNTGHEGGLLFGMRVEMEDGRTFDIVSDDEWRCTRDCPEDWPTPDCRDDDWPRPRVIGPAGSPPWNLVAHARPARRVRSDTLEIVSQGSPARWSVPSGEWRLYVFQTYHHPGMDGGVLNYLDRRLAPLFIDVALRPYEEYLGERMGGPGLHGALFDTEGDYGWNLAWSEDLARSYLQTKGRDIRQWMPLLFDRDVEGRWPRARWDWFDVVSEVYSRGWFGAISDWFRRRRMSCSLQVSEGSLQLEAYSVGNLLQAHRACTLPGNDALFDTALRPHDFKEVHSVAEFEGRRHLCEMLGVAGWTMTPVRLKQCTNAAITWGADLIEPHVTYIDRDMTTIPYPPDWYTQNPFFGYLHVWADFCRRACFLSAQGRLAADVLLYYPIDSVWSLEENGIDGRESFDPLAHRIDQEYHQAITDLAEARIDSLVGDDHYLRLGKVEQGSLGIQGFRFRAVILTTNHIMPRDVAGKLLEFARAGGYVVCLGDLPSGSTEVGLADEQMRGLMESLRAQPTYVSCTSGLRDLIKSRHPAVRSKIQFESGEFNLLAAHRRIDGRDFFWLANNDDQPRSCKVLFRDVRGRSAIWNCETGAIRATPATVVAEGCRLSLRFHPYEAYWLVFDPKAPEAPPPVPPATPAKELVLARGWQVRIDRSVQPVPPGNVPMPIPERFAFAATGPSAAGPNTPSQTNQWTSAALESWRAWGLDEFTGFVDYQARFDLPSASKSVVLDLGCVKHMAQVWVNGRSAGRRLWPPFEYDVCSLVQPGENILRVRVGNLFCNAMKPLEERKKVWMGWGYQKSTAQQREAGLLGPVRLLLSSE